MTPVFLTIMLNYFSVECELFSKVCNPLILVTISAKSFFQQNFNLKWTRIQRGLDLGCFWMLFFTVEKGLLARP
jgi:hypothetical protein